MHFPTALNRRYGKLSNFTSQNTGLKMLTVDSNSNTRTTRALLAGALFMSESR